MRIFNELTGRDQGVYLMRKKILELKESANKLMDKTEYNIGILISIRGGIVMANEMIKYSDDLLDIATLGDIEESSIKPIGKQICTDVREVFGDYD